MEPKRIYLSPPHLSGNEEAQVASAIRSNWIAPLGPEVDAFERELAECAGGNVYVAALSSGTSALHLALILAGVKAGDRVMVSNLTFVAAANAVRYVGAQPVFVDADAESWNLDINLLAEGLRKAASEGNLPRALVAVDLYGQCADWDPINQLCREYGVICIEDAAEALGAFYKGRPAGGLADFGVFSFNGNKIITTSGGGALICKAKEIAERARYLGSQARESFAHYEHTETGFNYRMSNVLAALGRAQLATLEERVRRRRAIFEYYREHLKPKVDGLEFMPEPSYSQSTRWLTCMTLDPKVTGVTPEQVRVALERENIEARPVWKPMHLQPLFAGAPVMGNAVSAHLFETGLCLPSGSSMTDGDLERVVAALLKVLEA